MDTHLQKQAEILAEKLLQTGLRLATAESCTGGWISQVLTSVPGSSSWFEGAIVSYSNDMKCNLLGVSSKDLESHGAVSQPVVQQMALGVAQKLRVPLSVSISGIAGPGGGTDTKPVGTVWIGWCFDTVVTTECYHFEGDREEVRRQSVEAALNGLLRIVGTLTI